VVFCSLSSVWYFPHTVFILAQTSTLPLSGKHRKALFLGLSEVLWQHPEHVTPDCTHSLPLKRWAWGAASQRNNRKVKNPITKISSVIIFTWIIDWTTTTNIFTWTRHRNSCAKTLNSINTMTYYPTYFYNLISQCNI